MSLKVGVRVCSVNIHIVRAIDLGNSTNYNLILGTPNCSHSNLLLILFTVTAIFVVDVRIRRDELVLALNIGEGDYSRGGGRVRMGVTVRMGSWLGGLLWPISHG